MVLGGSVVSYERGTPIGHSSDTASLSCKRDGGGGGVNKGPSSGVGLMGVRRRLSLPASRPFPDGPASWKVRIFGVLCAATVVNT